jgi:hypothetical protein
VPAVAGGESAAAVRTTVRLMGRRRTVADDKRRTSQHVVDPLADYPVGPDDAGNAVLHGIGLLSRAWRWFVAKLRR